MEIEVRTRRSRRLLILVASFVFVLAAVWMGKAYVAQAVAETPTVDNFKLALRLDPNNPEYHLLLGRLYEYSPTSEKPGQAMKEFQRAAELDPNDPQPWIDLAAAAEFNGDVSRAAAYLRLADYLAPHLPNFQWPIGNFYLLHGDTSQALLHFKVVLAGTRKYDSLIFSTAWKASGDAATILKDLIPDDTQAELSYLGYLMGQHRYADTRPLWNQIVENSKDLHAEDVASYMDELISAHLPGQAFQVWTDLEKNGIVRFALPEPAGNLVTNGEFEDAMLNFGFDWRIVSAEDVYAGLDTSNYHSPSHSLLVSFTGKENIFYRHTFEYVKVEPSTSYRLRAWMMTSGITTDSGPRLEVRDAFDPAILDVYTPSMTGDSNGWTSVSLDFKTSPKTELVILSVTRVPSQKVDNSIAGKVWLDDVSLVPLAQ